MYVSACVCVCMFVTLLVNRIFRKRETQMPHIERKNPIVFGGGQRSFGVTGGQNLKILLTRYLKIGSLDEFHT